MKKKVSTIAWLVVALAALAVLVWRTPPDAFTNALDQLAWPYAAAALALYTLAQAMLALRWVVLLRVHQVHISLFQAIRLTFLGLFYNNVMPGAVGGDLLKAWYATRHSKKHLRLEAAVTVFVDRVAGLVGMILVGAIASLFLTHDVVVHGIQLHWIIWAIFALLILLAIVFFSRRTRKIIRLDRIAERLPFAAKLRQIDQAIQLYRSHLKTVMLALLITVLIQGTAIVAIWILTQALQFDQVSFLQCLIIMPIIWLVGAAIPVPGGLGVIETCVMVLFCRAIDPQKQDPQAAQGSAVALALLIRFMTVASSLPGALVPLFGGHLPKADKMEQEIQAETTGNLREESPKSNRSS